MRSRHRPVAPWMLLLLAAATTAAAQAPEAAEPPPGDAAAAPPTGGEPAPSDQVDEPPPSTATQPVCQPACREGYVCVEGACVSACNPPCPRGHECTAEGRCVAVAQEPPPPAGAAVPPPPPAQPPPAYAESASDSEEAVDFSHQPGHRHTGFFLRFTLGFGGGSATERTDGDDLTLSGGGGGFGFDIGGAVTENLVLHARLATFSIVNPSVEVNEMELGSLDDSSLTFGLLGPAVTYYFMPINLYVTGAAGFGTGSLEVDGRESNTDVGFGMNLDVGIEWWVGQEWGLGAAARFGYWNLPEGDGSIDADLRGLGFALLFTATYN